MPRKSKLTADTLRRCREFVEQFGLYPEPHGATLVSFCKAIDIDINTYYNWQENSDFSDTIKKANAFFTATLERSLVGSLVAKAKGDKLTKKRTIGKPDKDGQLQVEQVVVDELEQPKDAVAAIFLLKNIAPERWTDKQQHDLNVAEPIRIVCDEETKEALRGLVDR